jgi:hypothetical protein
MLSSCQLIEQHLRLLQIERIKALGKPAVDRSEKLASLLRLALVAPEPRHAHCGAEFSARATRCSAFSDRRPAQSSGTELAFMSLISHLPLTLARVSSELVWAAMLFFALST